ncbi:unnamed protein product [Haemonchus placei]|uniref:Uncharacterized protein n=1 Tax=Haemonchus placei TaxID=6290 RepID=A0A3P7UKD3_HAEPC|nr:unnamed protein product [Haemonchus placei]
MQQSKLRITKLPSIPLNANTTGTDRQQRPFVPSPRETWEMLALCSSTYC